MCRQSKKDERVKWQKNTKPSHAHLLCTGVDTVVVVVVAAVIVVVIVFVAVIIFWPDRLSVFYLYVFKLNIFT